MTIRVRSLHSLAMTRFAATVILVGHKSWREGMTLRRHLISFTKMESGGNDFIIIDDRRKILPRKLSKLAVNL